MSTCLSCYRPYQYCTCSPVCEGDCPVQLDSACVFYHKANSEVTELPNLDISNGATLESILEAIDTKIEPLTSVLSTTLTYLRTKYVINNLTQFLVAVSTELGELNDALTTGDEWTTVARPSSPTEGQRGYNLSLHQYEYWDSSAWVQY